MSASIVRLKSKARQQRCIRVHDAGHEDIRGYLEKWRIYPQPSRRQGGQKWHPTAAKFDAAGRKGGKLKPITRIEFGLLRRR